MNYRLMSRYIYTTVFLRRRKSENMVVFINSSAYSAKTVMAVRKYIRNRKFFKTTGARRLNNPNIRYIMRSKRVKVNPKSVISSGSFPPSL